MYFYVDATSEKGIALMPTARGRAAKNHMEIEYGHLSFYYADPAGSSIKTIPAGPEYMKDAVANGTLVSMTDHDAILHPSEVELILMKLCGSLLAFLKTLPTAFTSSLPENARLQIGAVLSGLDNAFSDGDHIEIAEIIHNNHKMFNTSMKG